MATWDQVANYMRSNFKIRNEEGRVISLVFNLDDGRSQLVIVSAATTGVGAEWLLIESAVGMRGEVDMEAAASAAAKWPCGGIAVSTDFVTIRHGAPMENLDINELLEPMRTVVLAADEVEGKLSGQDRF